MGDLQVCSPRPNGILIEDPPFLLSSSPPNPDPLSIGADCWLRAERRTHEIICRIQPTVVSEQRRKAVVDYVQRLIRGYLGSEVFPYGSVPLKTYLPDGDIDLTAHSIQNVEDALANDVRAVLEVEEQNRAAEFEVKDIQYIHAEVKLVKCLVQNIVVDISFNQLGGLCTLCFLERVDCLIGKDHLFKRSIILIKAWCYYESRILGAHHGLISTYALETLVLYIFHLFHSSLNGPLAVLYRFLDYFSKFKWDEYCISLYGRVCIHSLPDIVVETPDNDGADLLLSNEFLRKCVALFSVPPRGLETNSRAFTQKHLNIVDPLKENNNLGRSVSKGNFYRIRSAFTYGARKLGRILLLPGESIADELNKFFMNTLDRHGSGQRPDVQDPVPGFIANGSDPALSKSDIEKCIEDMTVSKLPSVDSSGTAVKSTGSLCEGISDVSLSGTEKKPCIGIANEPQRYTSKLGSTLTVMETDGFANGNAVSGYRLAGDAKDLATSRTQGPRISKETPKSTLLSGEPDTSPLGRAYHAPHLYFSHSSLENGKIKSSNPDQTKPTNSGILENKVLSRLPRVPDEETGLVLQQDPEEIDLAINDTIHPCSNHEVPTTVGTTDGLLISSPIAYTSEDLYLGYGEGDLAGTAGSTGALNSLTDLSGDYESHLNSLLYARSCHEYAFCGPVLPIPPPLPTQFQNKHAWDTVRRSMQLKRNAFPHMNANGVISGPPFYPTNPPIIPGAAFGVEMPKPRGTGTYFPNTNHGSYSDKPLPGRGRNQASVTHGQLQRLPHESGPAVMPPDTNLLEKGGYDPTPTQLPVLLGRTKPGSPEFFQAGRPAVRGFPHANGFLLPSEKLEFGSFGHLPSGASLQEVSRQPVSSAPHTQVSPSRLPTPAMQRPRPVLDMNQERSYHLKDEDDFPPLSV